MFPCCAAAFSFHRLRI